MRNTYDVIIAGGGLAGLNAALSLDPGLSVLMLCKRELELSNSALAQGGIAAVFDRGHDDYRLHIADTLIAGGYKNSLEALEVLVTEGPEAVQKLITLGVEFDEDTAGKIHMTLEAGHSRNRILHHKDSTGFEVVKKLISKVKSLPNVDIFEDSSLATLSHVQGGFHAGILQGDDTPIDVFARYCILATGGIGRVYQYTTNSAIATGDGISLAYRMGANIKNLSLVQFHPTAFAADVGRERFLISEAVRGEGAVLLNCDGYRFMFDYHPKGELAPRDVVSRGIASEAKKTNSEKFYLDIISKGPEFLKDRFPLIYSRCLEEGIDITKDRIPVFPCQHYLMGGIDVDTWSRTTVSELYAVGECSHTGVHGMNRLASNSLLEALVFSRRAALDISGRFGGLGVSDPTVAPKWFHNGENPPTGIKSEIREIMQSSYFVFPDKAAIKRNIPRIKEISKLLSNGKFATDKNFFETQSLTDIAKIILTEVEYK